MLLAKKHTVDRHWLVIDSCNEYPLIDINDHGSIEISTAVYGCTL